MKIYQHSLIKVLPLIIFSVFTQQAYAECNKDLDVLIRNGKDYSFEKRNLQFTDCKNGFENQDFKIVAGTDDEAISFEADPELIKKAANVLYHLTLAKNFWIDNIKSEYVKSLSQITIRLEMTNSYSRTRHFKNAELEENYNNAWTTPAGQTPKFIKDGKAWGQEIWFSPMKVINAREEVKTKGKNPIHNSIVVVDETVSESQKNSLIYQGLQVAKTPSVLSTDFLTSAVSNVGVIAFLYGAKEVTKHMDKFFTNKYYYIDTAMVPEIIYHEFAHVALSDTLKTVHSVPVIEGLADYFAARLQTDTTLYRKLEGYSLNRTKKLNNKSLYHPYLEKGWNAESDYVVSLLWKAKANFEEANQKRIKRGLNEVVNFDQLVFKTHLQLDEESDIMNDLTRALLNSCRESCSNRRYGMDILHKTYEQKGLN
ncbi:MAG: hypothetical protein CME62_14835 [Halobacteriovoraceae bacterium]|nr:hypothetical protein [Halobacteriovoraceae bacterium]|tara:strand:- start:779 stop:2056 length:1278 start_codon:yes stop_codon:yes gene_type:complete